MNKKRKIILIMTDSQRADMVGCYGNLDMKTPSLNKLAEEGMRFDRAYTTQPVCAPARSAIFTGTFPHSNCGFTNSIALGDNVKTIGHRLRDNGIHTAYVGKWHLDGGDYFGLGKCPGGWDKDYWYDMKCYLEELNEHERRWSRTPKIMEEKHVTEDFTYAHRCSNRAIDFLEKYNNDDFFLVISYDEPHDPYVCPEPYSSMYMDYEFPKSKNIWDTLENKPEHQKVWAGDNLYQNKDELKIKEKYFLGCNSFVDYEIGRVIEGINSYAPDALVIYTSDHGEFLCSHSLNGKGPAAYDEITRIPFVVRWPEVVEPGTVCVHPTSHIDIVPTIMEAAGLPIPKLLEGNSMCKTLENAEIKTNDEIFIEFTRYEIDHDGFGGYQPLRAVFDGRYKLVINLMTSDELYDVQSDPEELVNLIDSKDHIEIRNKLHDKILKWMNETRDPFRGYYWERRAWRTDAAQPTWNYTSMTRQRENEEYEPRQLDYSTGLEMVSAIRSKI